MSVIVIILSALMVTVTQSAAQTRWVFGDDTLPEVSEAETIVKDCLQNSKAASTCVGAAVMACSQQQELCIQQETAVWQMLGDEYYDNVMKTDEALGSFLSDAQSNWVEFAQSRCAFRAAVFGDQVVMQKLETARCYLTATSEQALFLRSILADLR